MAGTDYGDNLRSTLDAARKQILDLGQSTAAQRLQKVVALGHAEQALSVAENALDRNQGDLATAYVISGVAVQGGALIQNADQLADLAKTAAESANSALSVAATSIKTLASAFDRLARSIAGVGTNAANDDRGSAMSGFAKKAEDATNTADGTVEQLKAASISASIQSAKSMAGSAATTVNVVGGELQDLVDRAGALLGAAQQRVSDSTKQRAVAAQAERAAQMAYRQAKIDSEALDDGTTNMDVILNGSLTVKVIPLPDPTPKAASDTLDTDDEVYMTQMAAAPAPKAAAPTPKAAAPTPKAANPAPNAAYALEAKYTIPFQAGGACYFFALLEEDAAGFSYHDAKTAVVEFNPKSPRAPAVFEIPDPDPDPDPKPDPKELVCTASIKTATTGDPITPGQPYRVFAFHVPKGGPWTTNASDLSYPYRSILVAGTIPDHKKYKIGFLELPERSEKADATPPIIFRVQVQRPPTPACDIMEYRAFLLLEDVYQAVRCDTVLLAGRLAPSSYKAWPDPPGPAGGSSGNPVFVYQEGDTDAYGDIVSPDTHYELSVLLVPEDGTMQKALLPAVPFKTGSPVPTVIPVAIPDLKKYAITFLPLTETSKKTDATPPIIFQVQVQRPPTPATPTTPAGDIIMEYRAFLLLEDVHQAIGAVPDDTALLSSLLALSSYKLPSPPLAGDSSGNPVFVYQVRDTDAHGDIVAPDTNYELRVLLVPKDGTMKNALLPAVPFKTGSPVPTVIPVAIPDLEKYAITFLPLTETSKKADATPQIISRVQVQRPPTPATPATPAGDIIMEYRAFLLPKDVDQAIGAAPDDTVLLASLLALSSYKLPSPLPAGDSSGPPVFVYQVGDTDEHGDNVAPDTNYELRVLLVPKDGTMKRALLPAVPFRTGSPVPTMIPTPPAAQVVPPPSKEAPPSPAPGAVENKPGTAPVQATAPGAQPAAPASTGGEK